MSIPMKENGELMQDSELGTLTAVEIQKIREEGLKLNQDSKDYIDKIKMCEESYKNKMKDLDKTVGKSLVGFYEQYLINKYGKDEKIKKYIEDLGIDIVTNIDKFKEDDDNRQNPMAMLGIMGPKIKRNTLINIKLICL